MKTKVIAFAGGKGSGKTTCMNFLHGYQLRAYNVIEDFAVSSSGSLVVKTEIEQDGKIEISDTYLDVNRQDPEFIDWCMYNVWPFIKKYSFADPLKQMAIALFGLKHEQVYGTQEHKKQVVPHLKWENMPGVYNMGWEGLMNEGRMTAREFLQYFGTDVCRRMHENIWADRCINDIKNEQPMLAVIDDCRFPNEIEAIQEIGGKVIGLNRSTEGVDLHSSEQDIKKSWNKLDSVINNQKLSIHETCAAIIDSIKDFGWLQEEIVADSKNPNKTKIHTIKEN